MKSSVRGLAASCREPRVFQCPDREIRGDRISRESAHQLVETSVIQLPKFSKCNVPNFGTITQGGSNDPVRQHPARPWKRVGIYGREDREGGARGGRGERRGDTG